MLRRVFAAAGMGLALLLMLGAFDTADAKRSGARSYHGGHVRAFSGRSAHRHVRVRRLAVGVPLVYGAYSYGNGCHWLKRRALATGSGYWWDRYYACLDGYY